MSARVYGYVGEHECDTNAAIFKDCIDHVAVWFCFVASFVS